MEVETQSLPNFDRQSKPSSFPLSVHVEVEPNEYASSEVLIPEEKSIEAYVKDQEICETLASMNLKLKPAENVDQKCGRFESSVASMEVETQRLPDFDLQSKELSLPLAVPVDVECHEAARSDNSLSVNCDSESTAIDAQKYAISESSVVLIPEDKTMNACVKEYANSETLASFNTNFKTTEAVDEKCERTESAVALSSIVKAKEINGQEGESSQSTAAVKLQKIYRSYRTRRRLADSNVVAEELWWQAIDYAWLNHSTSSFFNSLKPETAASRWKRISLNASKVGKGLSKDAGFADLAVSAVTEELWWQAIDYTRLNHSTISFFNYLNPETTASRWNRISLNASKVGKGLSKDAKAMKLAFQHWIEAIDPRHRYGHNLQFYYDEWRKGSSGQPFFYWLNVGDGREVDLKDCPRSKLRQQCIKYLGPQERKRFEYIVIEGKIVHKQTGELMDTTIGSQVAKWIFVMSTFKELYAGEKKKGTFHHSSFLAGGATLAAGKLVAVDGVLKSISPDSGHYRPTDLGNLLGVLKENGVNTVEIEIQKHSSPEDYDFKDGKSISKGNLDGEPSITEPPQYKTPDEVEREQPSELTEVFQTEVRGTYQRTLSGGLQSPRAEVPKKAILQRINSKKVAGSYQLGPQVSLKWSTGAGPRIGCIADYPKELRVQAMEFVDLSPRAPLTPSSSQ